MNAVLVRPAEQFSPVIGAMARHAASVAELTLIATIERTVDTLNRQKDTLSSMSAQISAVLRQVQVMPIVPGAYIDPDDEVVNSLGRSASALEGFLANCVRMKATIDRDKRLDAGDCERLHAAFDASLGAQADAIEAIKSLRALVISRDLAAESREGAETFETCDALVQSLRDQLA